MRTSLIVLLLAALVVAGCGKEADDAKPKAPAGTSGGSSPSGTTTSPGTSPAAAASWTGTLEKMGISIVMQGTHKLVEAGKTVAVLQSKTVDLVKYEGKRVTVTGTSAQTVEGNQTIVDVQEISEAP